MSLTATVPLIALALYSDFGIWLGIPFLLLILPFTMVRVGALELSLPIPARTILIARLTTQSVAVGIPCVIWIVSAYVRTAPTITPLRIGAILCVMLFCLIAPYLWQPHGAHAPPMPRLIAIWLSVLVPGFSLVYFFPERWTFAITSACVFTGWIIAMRRAPASYVVQLPLGDTRGTGTSPASASPSLSHTNDNAYAIDSTWCWPIVRGATVTMALLITISGILGFVSNALFYLAAFVPGCTHALNERFKWTRPLPISVRSRVRMLVVCTVALPIGVMTISAAIASLRQDLRGIGYPAPHALAAYDKIEGRTQVPLSYWQRSDHGVPEAVSPWGERSPAYTIRLIGTTYYNPYSTVATSSDSFITWQRARISSVVYGRASALQEHEGADALLPIRTDNTYRIRILYSGVVAAFILLLLWLRELTRDHRLIRSVIWRSWGWLAVQLPLFVVVGIQFTYYSKLPNAPDALLIRALFRFVQWLPNSSVVATTVALFMPCCLYFLYEWQATRSEETVMAVRT